jgi:hypothetical protein
MASLTKRQPPERRAVMHGLTRLKRRVDLDSALADRVR